MKELVNFEHFRIIKEAETRLEAHLDRVVEQAINEAAPKPAQTRAGALFQNPVKFLKIKNNAKKYQQALVQKALNNVDYEKKIQASGGEVDADKKEVLRQANAAKNQALTDKASAISDRMTTLATSPGLQAVKSLAMSKAKVAAAETALKAADAEETKQLKIQIKKLNAQAAKAEQDIKDYEKAEEPKAEEPQAQEQPQQQEMPKVKDNKPAAETKPVGETKPEGEDNTEKINVIDSKINKLKADKQSKEDSLGSKKHPDVLAIERQIKAEELEKAKLGGNSDDIAAAQSALNVAQDDLKAAVATEEDPLDKEIADQEDKIAAIKNKAKDKNSPLASPEVLAKALEPEENKLKDLKDKKAGKNESAGYIGESFTDKFRRLSKNVNV